MQYSLKYIFFNCFGCYCCCCYCFTTKYFALIILICLLIRPFVFLLFSFNKYTNIWEYEPAILFQSEINKLIITIPQGIRVKYLRRQLKMWTCQWINQLKLNVIADIDMIKEWCYEYVRYFQFEPCISTSVRCR